MADQRLELGFVVDLEHVSGKLGLERDRFAEEHQLAGLFEFEQAPVLVSEDAEQN